MVAAGAGVAAVGAGVAAGVAAGGEEAGSFCVYILLIINSP
jgi:hypothetical protein